MEAMIQPQTTMLVLTGNMVVIKNGMDAGNIRVSKRPRKTIEKIKNETNKSKKVLRAEKALDTMMKQGALWALSETTYQDTNPYYFTDENGKRLTGSQMRKLKKQGVISY